MRIEPEISGVDIIVLGAFNPALFTPAWFVLHGLLPEGAADSAEVEIIHPLVTEFTFDWLQLKVTAEHFSAETSQAPHVRVRDLVVRVFREYLPHTPLKGFEINRRVHFRVRNPAERDRIGRTLAPVEPWGRWGPSSRTGRQAWWDDVAHDVADRPAGKGAGRPDQRHGGAFDSDR